MTAQEVTTSEMGVHRECPAKWGYRYADNLRIASSSTALAFGRMFDAGVAAACAHPWDGCAIYGNGAVWAEYERIRSELGEETRDEDGDAQKLDDTRAAAEWAVLHFTLVRRAEWDRIIPLAIKRTFSVPVLAKNGSRLGHLRFLGEWDFVGFDIAQEDFIVVENKTHGGPVDGLDRRMDVDPQTTGYVYALRAALRGLLEEHRAPRFNTPRIERQRMTDAQIEAALRRIDSGMTQTGRVIMNIARRKLPSSPHVNMSRGAATKGQPGLVSTAAIDTPPEFYESALCAQEARGLPRTDEQRARLAELVARGDTFLGRREVYRSDDEIELWRRETIKEAGRIRLALRDPSERTRNPGACCTPRAGRCEYRDRCLDGIEDDGRTWVRPDDPHVELERETALVVE